MAGAWPEPGRSYWPEQQALFIFFSPAPASSGQTLDTDREIKVQQVPSQYFHIFL